MRDEIVAAAQRDGRIPSITAAFVDDGQIAWSGSAGDHAGPSAGAPEDTQYRIGSISKTFTAVLLLQAAEAGLVDLTAPLGEYLPEAPYSDRSVASVLSHTSGMPAEPSGPWWERAGRGDFAALVAAQVGVPPMAEEGVEFRYSNLGYGLLGEIAARAFGAPWRTLVETRIIEPLGMTRTSYHPTGAHATGYSVSHLLNTLTVEPDSDTGSMAPAGQLWSTTTDLARYADFLINGHPEVLDRAVLDDAMQPRSDGESPGGYGLGFRILRGPTRQLVGHTGTMPGFRASFFCDRDAKTASIALSNGTLGQDSMALAQALHDPTPVESGPPWQPTDEVSPDVRALVGPWFWGESPFEMRWNGHELELVELRGEFAYEEYALTDGIWTGTDRTTLDVVVRPDGSVSHFFSETYLFTRAPYDSPPAI